MAWTVSNSPLTTYGVEQTENATLIYNQLTAFGWSHNAICAVLGNMQAESTINPGCVEGWVSTYLPKKGYGLIQWTNTSATVVEENTLWAWTYSKYGDYDWANGDRQIVFINTDDASGWIPTTSYPMSYNEFKVSTDSIDTLTRAYFKNRERGTWSNVRTTYAQHWDSVFSGEDYHNIYVTKSGNGSITVSPRLAKQGDTITLTVTPASGETLLTLEAREISTGYSIAISFQTGTQTFPMVNDNVMITVAFSGTPPTPPTPTRKHKMPLYMMLRRRTLI